MQRSLIAWLCAVALSACMSRENMTSVETAAERFFELQAAGQDAQIFDDAGHGLRDAATVADLERLNRAVRAARGCSAPVRDQANWRSNQTTSGHFITVVYRRQCDGGELVESLVFQIIGGQAVLQGYNASGMALFPTQQPAETAPATPPAETPPAN